MTLEHMMVQDDSLTNVSQHNWVNTNEKKILFDKNRSLVSMKRPRPKLYCTYCRRDNHVIENCFNKKRDELNKTNKRHYNTATGPKNGEGFYNKRDNSLNRTQNTRLGRTLQAKNVQNNENRIVRFSSNSGSDATTPKNDYRKIHIVNETESKIEFLKSVIKINGINITAIFDTGAKTSSIPINHIKKYDLPIQKMVKCQMANNMIEDACLTVPLSTEVLGSLSKIQFVGLPRETCS